MLSKLPKELIFHHNGILYNKILSIRKLGTRYQHGLGLYSNNLKIYTYKRCSKSFIKCQEPLLNYSLIIPNIFPLLPPYKST